MDSFLVLFGEPKNNYYQVKKLVKFLKRLQTIELILENLFNGSFRRHVIFPYLKVERKKLMGRTISICEELEL